MKKTPLTTTARAVVFIYGLSAACFSAVLSLNSIPVAAQGFLEMPDTTEVPEYEGGSMLLDLDIPPVRQRDPDPEAGPRLNIKEFRLQGVLEFPELGISRKELIEKVEAIRFDMMKQGQYTGSGYTEEEIAEISDLIAQIEKETDGQHVGPLEVQKLVFLIRDQRRRRGITLGMVETVADTITRYYREKGFILAKAYIPEQKVRDGVVTLTLLLGELGEVAVENNKRTSDKLITKVFNKQLNEPITSWRTEEALYLINDIPGLSAQGFFSPGSQVGDTRLNINVLEERWFTSNLRFDNHGSENTSQYRAYADMYVHNPLGIGDEIYLAVMNSFDPEESTYGAFRYSSFVFHPRVRAGLGYSQNDFVSRNLNAGSTTGGALVLTGVSNVADVSTQYIFKRSRVKNLSSQLKFMSISTRLDADFSASAGTEGDPVSIADTKVDKISLSFNFDILNEKRRHLYVGDISLHLAEVSGGSDFGQSQGNASENEGFLTYDLSMLSFPKIPFTRYEHRMLIKSAGQYAGDALSNLNQISLTGPTRARAFTVNGLQGDDGLYLGVDWIFNLPKFDKARFFNEAIDKVFAPYVFLDLAKGILHPVESDQAGTGSRIDALLGDVGMGLKMNYRKFGADLFVAGKILDDVGDGQGASGSAGAQDIPATPTSGIYFQMQYSF